MNQIEYIKDTAKSLIDDSTDEEVIQYIYKILLTDSANRETHQ